MYDILSLKANMSISAIGCSVFTHIALGDPHFDAYVLTRIFPPPRV